MKKALAILLTMLSLCVASAQAQTVDSTQVHAFPDTSFVVHADSARYLLESADDRMSEVGEKKSDTVQLKVRRGSGHTKGMKLSTDNPVKNVAVPDSVLRKKHSPTIAGCLSIIPGGGQIYNKKYWKLPIVYVALGISGYFVYDFAHQMVQYKKEFINRRDGNTDLLKPEFSIYTDENLLGAKNTYRRRMEIAIAVTAVLYFLNIVDAVVDAHLYYFDISDDLSMRVTPQINLNYANLQLPQQGGNSFNYGVNLTFNFK